MPLTLVEDAARRVIRLKVRHGLFEHPYVAADTCPPEPGSASRLLAREAADFSAKAALIYDRYYLGRAAALWAETAQQNEASGGSPDLSENALHAGIAGQDSLELVAGHAGQAPVQGGDALGLGHFRATDRIKGLAGGGAEILPIGGILVGREDGGDPE